MLLFENQNKRKSSFSTLNKRILCNMDLDSSNQDDFLFGDSHWNSCTAKHFHLSQAKRPGSIIKEDKLCPVFIPRSSGHSKAGLSISTQSSWHSQYKSSRHLLAYVRSVFVSIGIQVLALALLLTTFLQNPSAKWATGKFWNDCVQIIHNGRIQKGLCST